MRAHKGLQYLPVAEQVELQQFWAGWPLPSSATEARKRLATLEAKAGKLSGTPASALNCPCGTVSE
jgi:hypothetical protein